MKTILIVIAFVFLISCPATEGGRGGGGRGGGGRGSSRGSSRGRGSSSSSTSSRSRYPYESKSKDGSKSSAPKPSAPEAPKPGSYPVQPSAPKPSAPEAPKPGSYPVQPSAPKAPVQSSPNQQSAYNPNAGPQNPPPYPNQSPGTNMGPPPPYMNQPPPYPGGNQRPPPYDFNQGRPGGAPYPQQAGSVNAPYPRQPGSVNAPYPQQPGSVNAPYPRQPGSVNAPYPRQPGSAPYPQQPGMNYGSPPAYAQYSGLPMAGVSNAKPYKKQGFLGQVFSSGGKSSSGYKAPNQYGSAAGGYGLGGGRSGISPAMYPMMPLANKVRKPGIGGMGMLGLGLGGASLMYLAMPRFHHHGYWNSQYGPRYGIDHESYRGRCRKPFTPDNAMIECNTTERGAKCRVSCKEGYRFADNATFKENECWHLGGVWRPSRDFPRCEPVCNDECQNGGKCALANACSCPPSYRGRVCEHHILNCDVRKIPGVQGNKIGWSCRHSKNETLCKIRCSEDMNSFLEEPRDSRTYHCTVEGRWTPESVPPCVNAAAKNTTTAVPPETVNLEAKVE